MPRVFSRTIVAAIVAASLFGCKSDSSGPILEAGVVTATTDLAFSPSTITVTRGGGGSATVTWTFESVMHTVTWDSQPAGATVEDIPGSSNTNVARDFTVAGTYSYHCSIHPTMTGTVIVQ
jgi:plastocyanin